MGLYEMCLVKTSAVQTFAEHLPPPEKLNSCMDSIDAVNDI